MCGEIELDEVVDCEQCGEEGESDNYCEGWGWVCAECQQHWEDELYEEEEESDRKDGSDRATLH
jgi:hypothetical protein